MISSIVEMETDVEQKLLSEDDFVKFAGSIIDFEWSNVRQDPANVRVASLAELGSKARPNQSAPDTKAVQEELQSTDSENAKVIPLSVLRKPSDQR